MHQDDEDEVPVLVPHDRITEGTLQRIAEDFCTRDGTDYGATETPLATRVAQLLRELQEGRAHVLFEARSQSLRVITEEERSRLL